MPRNKGRGNMRGQRVNLLPLTAAKGKLREMQRVQDAVFLFFETN